MYILNIDKSKSHTTPQIVGRVADLPYMDFEFMFKDGTKAVDLTGCTVEFRGLTSTDNKIISTESVTPKDSKNGTIKFKVPKNFYSAPGAFKRAYFAIKKNGRIDTTQDVIIHVLDSVDMDAQDAQDVIDAVDKIIADIEKQVESETDRLIQQIKNDTASTIADSNKKLADLDKQINDFKNNTNTTIFDINKQLNNLVQNIDLSKSKMAQLENRLTELSEEINRKDLLTKSDILDSDYISKNYALDSNNKYKVNDNNSNINFFPRYINKLIEPGKEITLSYDYQYKGFRKRSEGQNRLGLELVIKHIDGSTTYVPLWHTPVENKPNDNGRATRSLRIKSTPIDWDATQGEGDIRTFGVHFQALFEEAIITNIKLEKGGEPTSWILSPIDIASVGDIYDLQKQIDELSKIVTALGGS